MESMSLKKKERKCGGSDLKFMIVIYSLFFLIWGVGFSMILLFDKKQNLKINSFSDIFNIFR